MNPEEKVDAGEGSSKIDASDGDQSVNSALPDDSSSSSSSSEDEMGIASPPPNKRRRVRKYQTSQVQTCSDPRVDTLIQQVGYISQYLTNLSVPTLNIKSNLEQQIDPEPKTSHFLNNPSSSIKVVSLGDLGTDYDEKSLVAPANTDRLRELAQLQKFDTPAWKSIRYKKALQSSIATPGFVGLKLNEELCHFN